jgi:hypothetical protein
LEGVQLELYRGLFEVPRLRREQKHSVIYGKSLCKLGNTRQALQHWIEILEFSKIGRASNSFGIKLKLIWNPQKEVGYQIVSEASFSVT